MYEVKENFEGNIEDVKEFLSILADLKSMLEHQGIKVIVQKKYYTVDECKITPSCLYVFGDNLARIGTGGQACIRYVPNSKGIATKTSPYEFFEDNAINAGFVIDDVINVVEEALVHQYQFVVLPFDGLGTGLSELPERAPRVFKLLCICLDAVFGTDYVKRLVKHNVSTEHNERIGDD